MSIIQSPHLPKNPITRFAPSPTGYLHLGHVISMCYVFGIASLTNAKVLLRIEDHDRERCRKDYEQAILDDMAWLGFFPDNWEEFSQRKCTPYRQSDWQDCYLILLEELQSHELIYPCSCTRKDLAESLEGSELFYPRTCRNKKVLKQNNGIRLLIEDNNEHFIDLRKGTLEQNPFVQCGDFLLKDRRQNFTYNFCVVVDDIRHGVNLIIRGEDILHCTGRQIALNRHLNGTNAPIYYHHPLALDEGGKKLSKRTMAEGIIHRRLSGCAPETILGEALFTAGILPTKIAVKAHEIPKIFSEVNLACLQAFPKTQSLHY